jgi:hypothetical protein
LICKCGAEAIGQYARFCEPCRAQARKKPEKWVSTPRIDDSIRKIYQTHPQARTKPGVTELAERLGWPKWAVCRRARMLGVARIKEQPWSEDELAILERCAWMSDDRLSVKLKEAGFTRSKVAIHLKLKRMRFKKNTPYYSATGLALAFGIDSHAVTRWIKNNQLRGQRRETARTESQGGDMYLIHENDVRRFCRENPMEFDLRKVDQVWFMDLIAK